MVRREGCAARRTPRSTMATGSSYMLGDQDVSLYLYDLSKGAAKTLAPALSIWMPQEDLEGLWHSAVVVFGEEYFFNGQCVHLKPGHTSWGKPTKVLSIGTTSRTMKELHQHVVDDLKAHFTKNSYDVLELNCNHFSDRLCQFLCGRQIPTEILHQAQRLAKLPAINMLRPVLNHVLGGASENNAETQEVTTTCGSSCSSACSTCSTSISNCGSNCSISSLSLSGCGMSSFSVSSSDGGEAPRGRDSSRGACYGEVAGSLCGPGIELCARNEDELSFADFGALSARSSEADIGALSARSSEYDNDGSDCRSDATAARRRESRIPVLPAAAAALALSTRELTEDEREFRQALYGVDGMGEAPAEATQSAPPSFWCGKERFGKESPSEVEYEQAVPDERRCFMQCHSLMFSPAALGGC